MKKINVSLQEKDFKMLQDLGGKYTPMALMCVQNFLYTQRYTRLELKKIFTKNELTAIVDSYNGTIYSPEWASMKDAMLGQIEDSEKFESISSRWDIDVKALCDKIRKLTASRCLQLQFEIYRFWNIKEAYNNNLDMFLNVFV